MQRKNSELVCDCYHRWCVGSRGLLENEKMCFEPGITQLPQYIKIETREKVIQCNLEELNVMNVEMVQK